MSSRRMIILIVAVVVAAVSAFGLLTYVRSLDDEAKAQEQTVPVWFVTTPIAKGTPAAQALEQRLISQDDIPVRYAPPTAILDPDVQLKGLVAVTDLPPNSVLVDGNFVSTSVVNTGITDRLEERGMVSMTFNISQVDGAAHLMEPGDFVNMLTLVPVETDAEIISEEASAELQTSLGADENVYDRSESTVYNNDVRYVYQKVEILAIDRALPAELGETEDPAASANKGLVTVAVPPEALQIILGVGKENLYLSLVPQNYEPYALPAIDINAESELLPGEDALRLTPYGAVIDDLDDSK